MVGIAVAPSVRRGLVRVVSGDPVAASWRIDPEAPALVLELRTVAAAGPAELTAVRVESRLVDGLGLRPPPGMSTSSASADSGWAHWTGSVPLDPGGTARLRIPCSRTSGAAGRLDLVYRYRSVLSPMSSSTFVDVDATGEAGDDGRT